MATGFDIRDVDPEAFISDQRQGEGKGGDRGVSLQIIDDVLENSKGLFEENGLNDELAEKLKQLWISKLDAFNVGSEEQEEILVAPKTSSKKSSGSTSIKNVTFSTKSKRRKEEAKTFKNKLELVNTLNSEPQLATSSILEAPKSIDIRKKSRIGNQVDGPNDTSDEEEDIGNENKFITDFLRIIKQG